MTTLSKPGRKPGTPKTGGRQAGTPNRTTRRAREVVVEVIENNAERIQGWLDQISKTDGPREALRAYTALLEFAIPKMARNEVMADEQTKLIVSWIGDSTPKFDETDRSSEDQ